MCRRRLRKGEKGEVSFFLFSFLMVCRDVGDDV